MLHDFKSEIKLFFIVAVIGAVVSVAGVFLLRTMESTPSPAPIAPQTPPSASPSPGGSAPPPGAAIGISFEEDTKIGPFPPQALRFSCLPDKAVKLEWFDADALARSFNVYKKEADTGWIKLESVAAQPGQEWFSFVDKATHEDTSYFYAVAAIDVYGSESAYSYLLELPQPCE